MSVLWKKSLEILEKSINPTHVRAWLTPLQARLDRDGLTLTASNGFVVSWVKNRYLGAIEQAVRQAANRELPIRIDCASLDGTNERPGGTPGLVSSNLSEIIASDASTQSPKTTTKNIPAHISGTALGLDGRIERSVPQRARQHHTPVGRQHALPLPVSTPESMPRMIGDAASDGAASPAGAWRFSFRDFVVGPSNELAFSASRSICRHQLVTDQFYLCSAPGLGKTHLLQAIGQELAANAGTRQGRVRLAYLTAEDFACRMVMALKQREMESFKAGFRVGVDVLLLEDIHFLQGKEKTQEELLATVKSLRSAGKKVVFTSSFLPKELPKLDSLLASQFCDGFMAVIDKPDFETRMAIIQKKIHNDGVEMPQEVLELIASQITTNVREMEGALISILAQSSMNKKEITPELAAKVIEKFVRNTPKEITIESIQQNVCSYFSIPLEKLQSKSRKRETVQARQLAMFFSKLYTKSSLATIGSKCGNKDHATVLHACKTIKNLVDTDKRFKKYVEDLENIIKV